MSQPGKSVDEVNALERRLLEPTVCVASEPLAHPQMR
jgi:hypothetical protein